MALSRPTEQKANGLWITKAHTQPKLSAQYITNIKPVKTPSQGNPLNYSCRFELKVQLFSKGKPAKTFSCPLGEEVKCSDFPSDWETLTSQSFSIKQQDCILTSSVLAEDESSVALLLTHYQIDCASSLRTPTDVVYHENVTMHQELAVVVFDQEGVNHKLFRLNLGKPITNKASILKPKGEYYLGYFPQHHPTRYTSIRYYSNDSSCIYLSGKDECGVEITSDGLSVMHQATEIFKQEGPIQISSCRRYASIKYPNLSRSDFYEIRNQRLLIQHVLDHTLGTLFVPGGFVILATASDGLRILHRNLECTDLTVKSDFSLKEINPVARCTSDPEGRVYLEHTDPKHGVTCVTLPSVGQAVVDRTSYFLTRMGLADAIPHISLDVLKIIAEFTGFVPKLTPRLFSPNGLALFDAFNNLSPVIQKKCVEDFITNPTGRLALLKTFLDAKEQDIQQLLSGLAL